MQELFAKVVEHLPRFLSDLIGLLTRPKEFLVNRASEETVADGLIFLCMAAVLGVILSSPMIGTANLVQTAILLLVSGVIVFAVQAFSLILSWKLVGGSARPHEHMVILAYSSAPLFLFMVVVLLLGWPNVAGADWVPGWVRLWGGFHEVCAAMVSPGARVCTSDAS